METKCVFSVSRIRTRTTTTTTRTRAKTTTCFHRNTPRKLHIYAETINNNQLQYRNTATPFKISKMYRKVYASGQRSG
jgi:hypothetical protein